MGEKELRGILTSVGDPFTSDKRSSGWDPLKDDLRRLRTEIKEKDTKRVV